MADSEQKALVVICQLYAVLSGVFFMSSWYDVRQSTLSYASCEFFVGIQSCRDISCQARYLAMRQALAVIEARTSRGAQQLIGESCV